MPCADSTKPLGASAIALDAVLILGTIVVPAPQMLKLARARSSQGLTPLTLCITLVFNACSVGGGLLSKWDQVEQHKEDNHGSAVIQQALSFYEHGEPPRGT